MSKTSFIIYFLSVNVTIISIVANILTPIIKLTISLKPVYLTTPLCELTIT